MVEITSVDMFVILAYIINTGQMFMSLPGNNKIK